MYSTSGENTHTHTTERQWTVPGICTYFYVRIYKGDHGKSGWVGRLAFSDGLLCKGWIWILVVKSMEGSGQHAFCNALEYCHN